MKTIVFISAAIALCSSCVREYSAHGSVSNTDTSRLPKNYPFATGYCDGVMFDTVYPPNKDSAVTLTTGQLPGAVMLDAPPVGDQGSQGSCAAWAAVYAAGSYWHHLLTGSSYTDSTILSPSYSYNQITKGNCTCTSIIDNLNILKYQGASPLITMPYSHDECSRQPDSIQKKAAGNFKIDKWAIVKKEDIPRIKRLLFEKHIAIIVVHVSANFEKLDYPFIWKEGQPATGELHAVAVTGYDETKNAFKLMNSWGSKWGENGFAWIDYDFFKMNAAEDCFVVF